MNKQNFFFKQKVTESEMDQIYADVEDSYAKWCNVLWRTQWGISNYEGGGGQFANTAGTLTITMPYATYGRASGKYMYIPAGTSFTLDPTTDFTPPTLGKSKKMRMVCYHAYTNSTPRVDGYGDTIYYNRADSVDIRLVEGAEYTTDSLIPRLLSDTRYPNHPQNGSCSLGIVTIKNVGGTISIDGTVDIMPNNGMEDPAYINAQDRIEGLGIQSNYGIDYWGTNINLIYFKGPSPTDYNPATKIAIISQFHGFGVGVYCHYLLSAWVDPWDFAPFTGGGPMNHGLMPVRRTNLKDADLDGGIWIRDREGLNGGQFDIYFRNVPAYNDQWLQVMCIKIH
jgi:hypothetical protein